MISVVNIFVSIKFCLVIRSFINVSKIGDANSVEAFAKHAPYTLGYGKRVFSGEEYIKAFAELDVSQMTQEAKQGLAGTINRFKTNAGNKGGLGTAKGHVAHAFLVADYINGGKFIKNVESFDGAAGQTRRTDIVIEDQDGFIKIEVKNTLDTRWQDHLTKGLKVSTSDKNGAEKAGQLLEDLSNFIRKVDDDVYPSEAYSGYKWVFTPDMIPNSRKLHNVPSDALIKKHTIDHLKKDEKALKTLIEKTGLDSSKFTQRDLDEYLDDLAKELRDAKFFEITKFKHIVKNND